MQLQLLRTEFPFAEFRAFMRGELGLAEDYAHHILRALYQLERLGLELGLV
ncbi:MAG: hypothetical protein QOG31_205, partial [Thermoplasmata archaeon]|nr:hypothetical protein [Thermoplasmata archaeon]